MTLTPACTTLEKQLSEHTDKLMYVRYVTIVLLIGFCFGWGLIDCGFKLISRSVFLPSFRTLVAPRFPSSVHQDECFDRFDRHANVCFRTLCHFFIIFCCHCRNGHYCFSFCPSSSYSLCRFALRPKAW